MDSTNAAWRRLGVWGGSLLAVSAVLPWIGDLLGSQSGYRVPLALAWDLEAREGTLAAGLIVAGCGVLVIVASTIRWAWPARQVFAGAAVVLLVAIAVQVARYASSAGAGVDALLNGLGPGVYLALAGGIMALLAPVPPRRPKSVAVQTQPAPAQPAPAQPAPAQPAPAQPAVAVAPMATDVTTGADSTARPAPDEQSPESGSTES